MTAGSRYLAAGALRSLPEFASCQVGKAEHSGPAVAVAVARRRNLAANTRLAERSRLIFVEGR